MQNSNEKLICQIHKRLINNEFRFISVCLLTKHRQKRASKSGKRNFIWYTRIKNDMQGNFGNIGTKCYTGFADIFTMSPHMNFTRLGITAAMM